MSAAPRRPPSPWQRQRFAICRTVVVLVVVMTSLPLVAAADRGSNVLKKDDERWASAATVRAASADNQVQVFRGNSTVSDQFHVLHITSDSLLLGARNVVYNLSLETLTENSRITWPSTVDDVRTCLMRQKTPEACQNYIRVIAHRSDDSYLVCGTNAFKPLCRTYSYDAVSGYSVIEVESGVARCPYDPLHNSTAIYINERLYSATVADPSSRDPLIYSKPLRTEQHDSQWLNDPNFVSSFHYEGIIYFFFRETAVENINCGKAVFSRVARVCTNDDGGVRVLRNTWTSFFKARLNCSIPGEFPFYFDEIQSTSSLGDGNVLPTFIYNDRLPLVYAVFQTPRNGLRGSAVCAFKMTDILASFEGPHKEQRTAHSNWLPVRDGEIPEPHPAKGCANSSTSLSDQTLNFIKSHPLMDRAVPSFGGQPLLIQSSFEYGLTQIAIDWQVYAADRHYYDVMFIGTDHGHVLKVINKGRSLNQIEAVVIEDIPVFSRSSAVTGLQIYWRRKNDRDSARLIVISHDEVRSLPLHRCEQKLTCSECVALRDPYCSWVEDRCVNSQMGYQSIDSGRHARCTVVTSVKSAKNSLTPLPSGAHLKMCAPCSCPDVTVTSGTTFRQHQSYPTFDSSVPSDANDVEPALFEGSETLAHSAGAPRIGPCYEESLDNSFTEKIGTLYAGGTVAGIVTLCAIMALIVGFLAGLFLSSHRQMNCLHSRIDKLWGVQKSGKNAQGPKHAVQNPYDLDPVKYQIPTYNSPTRQKELSKQNNIIFNELKSNNLGITKSDTEAPLYPLSRPLLCSTGNEIEVTTCTPPRPPPRRHRSIKR